MCSDVRDTCNSVQVLDAALFYANMGLRVLPVYGIHSHRCTCGNAECRSAGKHPLFTQWQLMASSDPEMVRRWWSRWPDANVAIACGMQSGLVVLDFDGEEGKATLGELERTFAELREAPAVVTGKGAHLYFPYRPELCRSRTRVLPGVDIRSDNSYVVAPPSLHSSGRRYEWEPGRDLESSALIPVPPGLVERLACDGMTGGNRSVVLYSNWARYTGRVV